MSARDFHVYSRDQLLKIREGIVAQIVSGRAKDYAEYKKLVGIIEGLDRAIATMKETMIKYHSGDVDEDE